MLGAAACSSNSGHGAPAQSKPDGGSAADAASADATTGAGAGTDGGAATDAGPVTHPVLPFQADPPAVYVAKVKNVLVGLPPTDDEVVAVTTDPAALRSLIKQWMKTPEYTQKMLRFFELAFQQTQISAIDFADQTYPKRVGLNPYTTPS